MPRVTAARINAVRHFNRFYTRQLGLLSRGLHQSPFGLTDARLLYEIATNAGITAADLSKRLGLDKGQLSRSLCGLKRHHLVIARPSESDKRRQHLALSDAGHAAFAQLDAAARAEVGARLDRLQPAAQDQLGAAMRTIEALLGAEPQAESPVLLRSHEPGDLG